MKIQINNKWWLNNKLSEGSHYRISACHKSQLQFCAANRDDYKRLRCSWEDDLKYSEMCKLVRLNPIGYKKTLNLALKVSAMLEHYLITPMINFVAF